jgi:NAD(P)-dependent dehydrogenase (short-subunit alcohol dehydrogenase family)
MTLQGLANRPGHRGRCVLVMGAGQGMELTLRSLWSTRRGDRRRRHRIEACGGDCETHWRGRGEAVGAECDVAKYDELAKACGELQNCLKGGIETIINAGMLYILAATKRAFITDQECDVAGGLMMT